MSDPNKWLGLFQKFIAEMRIDSKEVAAVDSRGSPLDLWGSQQMALEQLCYGLDEGVRTFIFLKSRQLGISTLFLAVDIFWLAVHPGTIGALVVDTEKNRNAFRSTLVRYVNSFPKGFLGKSFKIMKNNRDFMLFSNGSRLDTLVAGTSNKKSSWGEGQGYSLAHLCVAPGTPVIVEHGRIKPIEDIKIGDKVLTHTGAEATVVDILGQPNDKGPMLRVTPWLGQSIQCSEDHKIPTHRGLIEAKDLRASDWLIMPLRKITGELKTIDLPESQGRPGVYSVDSSGRFAKPSETTTLRERDPWFNSVGVANGKPMVLTEEVGFAIGYYLAEGHMIFTRREKPSGITFARHREEKAYADRACAALAPYTTANRKTVDRTDCLTSTDTIYGTPLCTWIVETFGVLDGKFIPDCVFSWGEEFCRGLLTGLLVGDGSKTLQNAQGYQINAVSISTTRSSLATQARDIAAALGLGWGSIRYTPGGERYGRMCKPIWTLGWYGLAGANIRSLMGLTVAERSGHSFSQKYRIERGTIFLQVRKIEAGIEEPEMWDITVDHVDHTFRTPHMSIGNSEVAAYGSAAGLESFEEALSENHPDRLFIYESTAKGMNHWRDKWIDAGRDKATKRRVFIGFWAKELNAIPKHDPRFATFGAAKPDGFEQERMQLVLERHGMRISQEQLAWRRWKDSKEGADEGMLQQNQPWLEEEAFVLTGYSFFNTRAVQKDLEWVYDPVNEEHVRFLAYRYYTGNDFFSVHTEKIEDESRIDEVDLRVWNEPVRGAQYVIGCDPAFGRTEWKDRHAISVWRCYADKLVQCAEYATNQVETRQCAWVLAHLAGAYRDCIVNLELTGPGRAVMVEFEGLRDRLRADMYEKQMEERGWDDFLSNARWYMYHRPDTFGAGYMLNTEMNFKVKFEMMNQLRDNYSMGLFDIRSAHLLEEMLIVTQEGTDISAPGRGKDDRVFALSLANSAWLKWVRPRLISEGMTYDSVTAMENGETNLAQQIIDRHVAAFFRRKEEEANAEPDVPAWLRDRGLA